MPARILSVLALLALVVGCKSQQGLRVEQAWARPTAGTELPAAVYLSIINDTDSPDRLVGVRSTCCASLEIHRTIIEEARMTMLPVENGIPIEPGATVALAPGGYHVMLFDLEQPLSKGQRLEITLAFERAGEIPVEVEVR